MSYKGKPVADIKVVRKDGVPMAVLPQFRNVNGQHLSACGLPLAIRFRHIFDTVKKRGRALYGLFKKTSRISL